MRTLRSNFHKVSVSDSERATTLNIRICGIHQPAEFGALISGIIPKYTGFEKAVIPSLPQRLGLAKPNHRRLQAGAARPNYHQRFGDALETRPLKK
jgi:hypothetical protein